MSKRSRKKKRKTPPVPIASMGDIAFLLIIFFLVCSDVVKENSSLVVALPLSEYVEKMELSVAARVVVDEDGKIYLDGLLVNSAADIERDIRTILANSVADDQRHVQFKCDAELSKDTFEPVMQAIAEAGGIMDAVGEKE